MGKILIEDTNIPALTNIVDEDLNPVAEDANRLFLRRLRVEPDTYTPGDGENDVTTMENWRKWFDFMVPDYIWQQLRIDEVLQGKAGATQVDKWNNCTNDEKDTLLYFNQLKGLPGGAEDTAKVTHLIVTGQVADAAEGAAWLRHNHSESVNRAKPAARERVDSDKLVEVIITYLSPADTAQLLDTMSSHLRNYRDFVLVGTVIPGNEPGLHDYINSTDIYTGNGLVEEAWTTLTGTLADLRDKLNDLLFGDNEITV
jgi:hypothetical protein